MDTPKVFKRVPFNSIWITHDKLDIKAIYRRPRFIEDRFGDMVREHDAAGIPTWDLTGGLPLRSHNKWATRGFEYVTLAGIEDLMAAAAQRTLPEPMAAYINHRVGGPWHAVMYLDWAKQADREAFDELRALVTKYGSEQVTEIKRATDPTYTLPLTLQNWEPGQTQAISDDEPQPVSEAIPPTYEDESVRRIFGGAPPLPPPGYISADQVSEMIAKAVAEAEAKHRAEAAKAPKRRRKA